MENCLLVIKKKIKLICGIIFALILPILVTAYSPYYTHPDLTAQMAKLFNNKYGLTGVHISAAQIEWLRQGAIE